MTDSTMTFDWSQVVWDIETNGFLPDVDKHWCLGIQDVNSGKSELFSDYDSTLRSMDEGISVLNKASMWVGHNIIGYDIPVLNHLGFTLSEPDVIIDTLITSQVLYPNIKGVKFTKRMPKKLAWSHSLEAWGHRLGYKKGSYNDWSKYTPEMGEYCLKDVGVCLKLLDFLYWRASDLKVAWEFNELPNALAVEHHFKKYIVQQELTGFPFDLSGAQQLSQPLIEERERITEELQQLFPPITEEIHYVTKVRKEKKTKVVTTVFNPGSRQQVGQRLVDAGWEPSTLTETGKPAVNEKTMAEAAELGIAGAASIDRYYTVQKRLGMILDGQNSWVRLERDGRIHGSVNTMGAVTTRVTHNAPNMSQVPSVGSYLGEECRSLFHAREGWSLVGADLSGIELRCLAHYLARWDGGEYGETLLTGDIHTVHQEAYGLPPGKEGRSTGKTITYGYLYGAGDWKLGFSGKCRGTREEVAAQGRRFREGVEGNIPALGKLVTAVKRKVTKENTDWHIKSINGHPLYCRSDHSALNTLLQSAGAQAAKCMYVIFHQTMADLGYVYGEHYETYGFFHDEVQVGTQPEIANVVGEILCQSALKAGETIGFRLATEAEYKTGYTWADTH